MGESEVERYLRADFVNNDKDGVLWYTLMVDESWQAGNVSEYFFASSEAFSENPLHQ